MSTILEALKKSEQERKLSKLPTLTDTPAPQEQARWPHWVILGLIIVAVGLLVLLIWQWDRSGNEVGTTSNPEPAIVIDNEMVESVEAKDTDGVVVNVVSYAEDPEQRFVMINGKMYRENEFVKTGLKVISIEPNSVILNKRGVRIELKP
jgi:hypothetical protein